MRVHVLPLLALGLSGLGTSLAGSVAAEERVGPQAAAALVGP